MGSAARFVWISCGRAAIVGAAIAASGCDKVSDALGNGLLSKPAVAKRVADVTAIVTGTAPAATARTGTAAGAPDRAAPASSREARPKAHAAAPATRRPGAPARIPVEILPSEPDVIPAVATTETSVRAEAPAALPARHQVAAVQEIEDERAIYTDRDTDVVPARLLTTTQAGPLFRGLEPDMNKMELVISPLGRVEQVRLISPTKRMTDMLLLSGAKTWQFAPALKNGQPVRYRTVFSWEGTP